MQSFSTDPNFKTTHDSATAAVSLKPEEKLNTVAASATFSATERRNQVSLAEDHATESSSAVMEALSRLPRQHGVSAGQHAELLIREATQVTRENLSHWGVAAPTLRTAEAIASDFAALAATGRSGDRDRPFVPESREPNPADSIDPIGRGTVIHEELLTAELSETLAPESLESLSIDVSEMLERQKMYQLLADQALQLNPVHAPEPSASFAEITASVKQYA